jgi:hypothetical protein
MGESNMEFLRASRGAAGSFCQCVFVAAIAWICCAASLAQPPATPPSVADPAAPARPSLPDTPAGKMMAVVLRALESEQTPIPSEDFNEAFKKQVAPEQVKTLCAQIIGQHGVCGLVKIDSNTPPAGLIVTVEGSKTREKFQIVLGLDKDGKLETLLLRPAVQLDLPPFKEWGELDAALKELGGKGNFGAWELKAESADAEKGSFRLESVHEIDADARLAIGSTFKLYVLGALAEAVKAGRIKWDDQLPIKMEYKSLPSGTMQDAKDGETFPVWAFTERMISISDNTATDHLIHRLSRSAVEDYMKTVHGKPEVNYPFLTTRELFALKLGPDTTMMGRWDVSGEAIRRDMVVPDDPIMPKRPIGAHHTPGEVANTNFELKDAAAWSKPRHIETIEWFASARELGRVMADLHRLEAQPGLDEVGKALRLNPGLPLDNKTWPKIAFKGGSEPGVLSLTWMLTRKDDRVFVITFGWNNAKDAVDQTKLLEIAPRAVGLLANAP